jgi:predicted porin
VSIVRTILKYIWRQSVKISYVPLSLVVAASLIGFNVHAQSSVAISGAVNLDITKGNGGTSPMYGSGGGKKAVMNDVVSRVNFDGKEDLGGGVYAGFSLQHFFLVTTGEDANQTANTFWDGRSFLKLGGGWGELYGGREYSPIFYTAVASDPWFWDTSMGQIGYLQFANYWNTSGVRTNNTVGYISPAMGGFTGRLAHSLGDSSTTDNSTGGSLSYSEGPVWASTAFDRRTNANGTDKDQLFTVAGAYDFGVIRPLVLYSKSQVAGASHSAFSLAATVPLMKGRSSLKVAVSSISDWDTTAAGDQRLVKTSVAYAYNLSKRTTASVSLASSKGKLATRTSAVGVGLSHSF